MTVQALLLHPAVLIIGAFAALWLALETGRYLARRQVGAEADGSGGAIEAAVFALLGLLLAFTFSGAAARFDHRRDLIVQEANAIGTAWLRIDVVPVAAQAGLRAEFRNYIASREAAYAAVADDAAFRAALDRSAVLQRQLWQLAIAASHRPDASPGENILLLPALNDMIDITTTRAMATQMHPPAVVYWMLLALSLIAALLAGFGMGNTRSWLHMAAFAAAMATTITIIIDMEYPRLGLITVDAFERATMEQSRPV